MIQPAHQQKYQLMKKPMYQAVKYFAVLILCQLLAWVPSAVAHTVRPAVVTVTLTDSGQFQVRIRLSAEQILAGIGPEYSDTNEAPNADYYDELRALGAQDLRALFDDYAAEFLRRIELRSGGQLVPLEYIRADVPPAGDIELARDTEVFLTGVISTESLGNQSELVWVWPRQYGSNVLRWVPSDPAAIMTQWLQPGELSEPYIPGGMSAETSGSTVFDYTRIGFEHIVPKGLDHILFVLGLFLLSIRMRPLLLQVTSFTVAHTITLGLTIYGVVALPASIVEPLIALSIAYVGIENCLSSRLHPWRVVLVFVFGLLHGMGFAGVLADIGLPEGDFLTALISFNVGVELGQLSVILAAFLMVGWWRKRDWYRSFIVVPLSLSIAMVGLYWSWERVFG